MTTNPYPFWVQREYLGGVQFFKVERASSLCIELQYPDDDDYIADLADRLARGAVILMNDDDPEYIERWERCDEPAM